MGFVLFILLNASLFVRPAEIVADLQAWQIYQALILGCLAVSFIPVIDQLNVQRLTQRPIHLAVVGMLVAVALSHLSHLNTYSTRECVTEFSKVVIYYFLLVALIDSSARFRSFLLMLVAFIVILAALALLQYHEFINIPALEVLQQSDIDPDTDQPYLIPRLRSTGIYNDPNDLAGILIVGIALSVNWLMDSTWGLVRPLWLAPIGLFGYALGLTRSRGGLLALFAGLVVLLHARFGWRKALLLAAIALPALLFAFGGGRQTDFSGALKAETGQSRVQLWSEALALFRGAPLFGIGQNELVEEIHHVAHNSFLHCYTELGFFGGTIFFGAFLYAIATLVRLGSPAVVILDPDLRRLRPYLLAVLVGYCASMLSLLRQYGVPTYMILGLSASYLHLAETNVSLPETRFDQSLASRVVIASCLFLVATYLFVRLFARWT